MTLMVFGSARSAPGSTTTALAVASWIENAVLVEADPDGGVLAVRYGLPREPGLTTLAASHDVGDLSAHAQILPGGTRVVVAPESATRSTHLWRVGGEELLRTLIKPRPETVIVDAGRLGPSSPALAIVAHASIVAVVCRPVAEELMAASARVLTLAEQGANGGLVLVGEGPYSATDVMSQLECPVLGIVADDRRGAEVLSTGGTRSASARSVLMRSARGLAEGLVAATSAELSQIAHEATR